MEQQDLFSGLKQQILTRLPRDRAQRHKLYLGAALALVIAVILVWALSGESQRQRIERLVRSLSEAPKIDREMAIDELKTLPRQKVYPALVAALPGKFEGEFWGEAGDYAREIKYSYVAKAVLALGSPVDQSFLEMLQARESDRRFYAAWLAGLLQDPVAIPALVRLLSDSDAKVRKKSLGSLLTFPQAEASRALVKLIAAGRESPDYAQAVAGLCAVPRQGEVALFAPLQYHTDPRVRIGLACILAAQKRTENHPLLAALSQDGVAEVRWQAIKGMYEIAPTQALEIIGSRGPHDPAWKNRLEYVQLLCRAGAEAQRPRLLNYLNDNHSVLGKQERVGKKVVTEVSYPVRKAAYNCLEQVGLAPRRAVLEKQITKQFWRQTVPPPSGRTHSPAGSSPSTGSSPGRGSGRSPNFVPPPPSSFRPRR